ncbi:MAG: hypothetical protein QGD92_08900 [Gammaproteobacteria bacterium]|nr:hypothetical protein [Gammaproteobacteria bacterium]
MRVFTSVLHQSRFIRDFSATYLDRMAIFVCSWHPAWSGIEESVAIDLLIENTSTNDKLDAELMQH